MIRNFPVDLAQHTLVQLRGRQPYLEHLDLRHLLPSRQIQGGGSNLIAPVDGPDLLDKGSLHSRGNGNVLIELLLRDTFIELGRIWKIQQTIFLHDLKLNLSVFFSPLIHFLQFFQRVILK